MSDSDIKESFIIPTILLHNRKKREIILFFYVFYDQKNKLY